MTLSYSALIIQTLSVTNLASSASLAWQMALNTTIPMSLSCCC